MTPAYSFINRSPGAEDTTAGSSNQANIIDGSSSLYLSPHGTGAHSYHHSQGWLPLGRLLFTLEGVDSLNRVPKFGSARCMPPELWF